MPLKVEILSEKAAQWEGWCKHRLAGLRAVRKPGETLKQSYALPQGVIAQIICSDICDIIRIWGGKALGFLCYPHGGDRTLVSISTGPVTNEFHRQIGGIAFPLVDDDTGTVNISFSDNEWQAEKPNTDNYGNIDWIGKNTAAEGSLSNSTILTWRGPACRHPVKAPNPYGLITGFSNVEQQVVIDGFPTDIYTPLSPFIYQSGNLIATAPPVSNNPGGQFDNLALVLGAALLGSSLVCVVSTNRTFTSYGFWYECYVRLGGSDQLYNADTNPGGWQKLAEIQAPSRPYTCFFFNQSVTEAQCIQGYTRTVLTLDLPSLKASFSQKSSSPISRTKSYGDIEADNITTPSRSHTVPNDVQIPPATTPVAEWAGTVYDRKETIDIGLKESGNIVIGAEYVDDKLKEIVINHTSSYQTEKMFHELSHFDVVKVPVYKGDRYIIFNPYGVLLDGSYQGALGLINSCQDVAWTTDLGSVDIHGILTVTETQRCRPPGAGDATANITATDSNDGAIFNFVLSVPRADGMWCVVESDSCHTDCFTNWANTPSPLCNAAQDGSNTTYTFNSSLTSYYTVFGLIGVNDACQAFGTQGDSPPIPGPVLADMFAHGFNPSLHWYCNSYTLNVYTCPNC